MRDAILVFAVRFYFRTTGPHPGLADSSSIGGLILDGLVQHWRIHPALADQEEKTKMNEWKKRRMEAIEEDFVFENQVKMKVQIEDVNDIFVDVANEHIIRACCCLLRNLD